VDDAKKAELRRNALGSIKYGVRLGAGDLLSLLSDSDEAARLREENERLREALEPFAAVAETHDNGVKLGLYKPLHDDTPILTNDDGGAAITLGHCRKAYAALSRSETKGGEE
jgi:hypothetical protein